MGRVKRLFLRKFAAKANLYKNDNGPGCFLRQITNGKPSHWFSTVIVLFISTLKLRYSQIRQLFRWSGEAGREFHTC